MPRTTRTAVLLTSILLLLAVGCSRSPEAKKARYLERGDRYFAKEQYREAALEYRNALRIESTNTQATRQLGLAYYQLGELGQAFRYFLKTLEVEPDNLEVRLKLGQIYLMGARAADARAEAARVLQKEPRNLDALILMAGAAGTPEEIDAAIRQLESARAASEAIARFHLALAGLYLKKGDQAATERELQEAAAREPKSAEAHSALASFYMSRSDRPHRRRKTRLPRSAPRNGMRAASISISINLPSFRQ